MIAPTNTKPSFSTEDLEHTALQTGKQPPAMPAGLPATSGINGPVPARYAAAPAAPTSEVDDSADSEADSGGQEASSEEYIVSSVAVELTVNGNPIAKYDSFCLHQSTSSHHRFELVVPYDALSQDQAETHALQKARDLLGQPLMAGFYYKTKPDNKRYFKGIVTDISFRRSGRSLGQVVISGGSPTLLLDSAPHIQSFTSRNLSDIAKKLFEQSGLASDAYALRPAYTKNLVYSCQYQETHYNYLCRQAAHWGEWFYYDGQKLFFGKPALPSPIKITYGKDTHEVQTHMNTAHVQPQHFGYNSSDHKPLSAASFDIKGLDDIGMYALQASQKLYKTPALQPAPVRAGSDSDVKATQKSAATAAAASLFTLEATTTNPYLYPGCVIELGFYDAPRKKAEAFTRFIVIGLEQVISPYGEYQARFNAIPYQTENLPHPAYHQPIAEPQLATVKANNDAQGRVKVQFDWQKEPTDWIRVLTPDAGSSGKVSSNRGFVAIPEVEDQVLIGFMHSHPDRPFVMGGMFHGKVGGGGGAGNNMKSLTSKSGHTVQLNDGGGITVKDKDQNSMFLDGAGNINITSKETITLTCGESSIEMDKTGTITIKGKDLFVIGKNIGVSASTQIGIGIAASPDATPTSGIGIKSTKLDIGTKTLTLSGKKESNLGGKTVNIGGGKVTNIASSKVKLN